MTIETHDQYEAAAERLHALGESIAEGDDQDEFFQINAAMLDYETRNHPAFETACAE